MTMYLPNSGLRPTGFEAGEFIEDIRMSDDVVPVARAADDDEHPHESQLADGDGCVHPTR